jgi:hypothetical protein
MLAAKLENQTAPSAPVATKPLVLRDNLRGGHYCQ